MEKANERMHNALTRIVRSRVVQCEMAKWPRDHSRVIFVSGRFRAPSMYEIEQNIRRAETAALALWRAGFVVLCPHMNTHFFDGAAPDDIWLKGDLELLRRCDGMVVIDNGKTSGVMSEEEFASKHGIPVCHDIKHLL